MRGIGRAGGRAGRRGVAIRFVSSLVLESSWGWVDDLTGGSTAVVKVSVDVHTRPVGVAVVLLGRRVEASERGATWTRQVSPSRIWEYRAASCELQRDRQSRLGVCVPGQSCHSDGLGPTGGS